MSFHLSDGVKNIPHNFDTLVCAGMGADTMVSILEAAPWLRSRQYRLILQCQSKPPMLRKYLSGQGWMITEEAVLRDGRFLYTIMEVVFEPGHPGLTEGECFFPPAMLANPSKETVEYFQRLKRELTMILANRGEKAEEAQRAAHAYLLSLEQNPNLAFLKEEIQ
jgi:tRNA A22 N-methylase